MNWRLFAVITSVGCAVILLSAFVWTIVFWNSPLLWFNTAIPLLMPLFVLIVGSVMLVKAYWRES